jgi:hypothetical protein
MKIFTRALVTWLLGFAACASSWQAAAGPIIGDKEWYQPADLLGYSWNDFNAVCNGGACNGLLGGVGPNLTGWTWASIYEVGDLFAATSPHAGGISTYQSPQLQPAFDFAADTGFLRTTDANLAINFGISGIAGLSSTLAPGGSSAYYGVVQASLFQQVGSTISTEMTYFPLTDDAPNVGAWLYRAADVPVPATAWLVALGVVALRWARNRAA